MPKTEEKAYLEMQGEVKSLLVKALKLKALSAEELMSVLLILGQTSNTFELEVFIDIFSGNFPVLKDFSETKKAEVRGILESKVKDAVSKIVKTDPLRAAEITKAALKPGVGWEDLIKEFPELKG